ncbi:MAG: ABC transporter substrate-binding protein [Alphaproteobacteria bacterium]
MRRYAGLVLFVALCMVTGVRGVARADPVPVVIGLDAEFGHQTSTSAPAIRQGILVAIDEINSRGGVLGGRPLMLVERDNRSVPARGVQNIRDLSANPDVVAIFCGKFSPVVLEEIPVVHQIGIPLLDPWAAADDIIDNGHTPNFVFRLSLRDGWAVPAMLEHAGHRGLGRIGVLVPNTAWGRGSLKAAQDYVGANQGMTITATKWYNWGDTSLLDKYLELVRSGANVVLLVANEREGSILVKEMASVSATGRLPVIAHWGISGGDFRAMTGDALDAVDLVVVQTYSFAGPLDERARSVLAAARRLFGLNGPADLKSQVGFAHAYDLTHILARAIDRAGDTDRAAIRDALERLDRVDGLIRSYDPPFTPSRHEALSPAQIFIGRFTPDGIVPVNGN